MRCYGTYKNDRECDLCKRINEAYYEKCKNEHLVKVEHNRKLNQIKLNCPFRKQCLDEYEFFDGCIKDNKNWGRHTPECRPSLECESHLNKI
jgi:hypothetical protein